MVAPIDYTTQVADPFAQALQGFKVGAGIQQLEQERQIAEQQKLQQQQYAQAISRLQQPGATAADFENVMLISNKDQAENIRKVMEGRDTRQNQASLKRMAPIAFALQTGNADQGVTLLQQEAEAARNSGDVVEAQYLTQLAEKAKEQPKNIGLLFGAKMTLIPGGKEVLDNVLKLSTERRTEEQAPAKLRQELAKADKEEAEAKVKMETATDDIAKAKAAREFEQAKAKKEQVQADTELQTRLADLGFKQAQINKFKVETRNLDTQGKMLSLDFQAALQGLPLPSKGEGGKAATEDERKAAGWLAQATNAYTNMLGAMYTKEGKPTGAEKPGVVESALGTLPFIGEGTAAIARSTDRQKFNQAASSLSEALLRAATGAGVNKDEAKQKLEELTPLFSDDEDTRKQKLAAIPVYLESLRSRAGRAAPKDYQVPTAPSSALSLTLPDGRVVTFPSQQALDGFKKSAGL